MAIRRKSVSSGDEATGTIDVAGGIQPCAEALGNDDELEVGPHRRASDGAGVSPAPSSENGAGSVDTILQQLESVVNELESGDLPLERALARFEDGVRLARRGNALLDAVEHRVEILLAERDEAVPFAHGDDEAS